MPMLPLPPPRRVDRLERLRDALTAVGRYPRTCEAALLDIVVITDAITRERTRR